MGHILCTRLCTRSVFHVLFMSEKRLNEKLLLYDLKILRSCYLKLIKLQTMNRPYDTGIYEYFDCNNHQSYKKMVGYFIWSMIKLFIFYLLLLWKSYQTEYELQVKHREMTTNQDVNIFTELVCVKAEKITY